MYAYPQDCIKARHIVPLYTMATPPFTPSVGPTVRFIVSGSDDTAGNPIIVILTDQPQAQLVYTTQITVPDIFDQNFTDALVYGLASNLAIALSGDKMLAKSLSDQSNAAVRLAESINGNEGPTVQQSMPDWIRARGYIGEYPTSMDPYNALSVPYWIW